jgi:phosphoribosylaminoimidazole-succinocarboxamide synthase
LANKKLLYETGAKKVYEGESNDQVLFVFNDIVIAADGSQKGKVKGKAAMNNTVSSQIFEYLESYNILTHFISKVNEKEMQVKKTEVLPINIIISNATDKNLSKRFGLEDGELLSSPIIEYYYENEKFKNPLVNESHLRALKLITEEEVHYLERTISKTNVVLKSFFERRNLILVRLNLQLGRYKGHLLVGDELTADTCQFWGTDSEKSLDKDLYNVDKCNIEEIYKNLYNQITGEG